MVLMQKIMLVTPITLQVWTFLLANSYNWRNVVVNYMSIPNNAKWLFCALLTAFFEPSEIIFSVDKNLF